MAYCCSTTLTSIGTSCESQMGGIKVVYGLSKAQLDSVTVTNDVITAITTKNDPDTNDPYLFHTYAFRKQSSTLTSTYTVDDTNGVKYVTSELNLVFAKQETAKRVSIMALANCESVFVVEDNNGKMWFLGYDNPVTVTAMDAATGTSFSDANQYSITLSDMSNALPYEVNISDFVENQTTDA